MGGGGGGEWVWGEDEGSWKEGNVGFGGGRGGERGGGPLRLGPVRSRDRNSTQCVIPPIVTLGPRAASQSKQPKRKCGCVFPWRDSQALNAQKSSDCAAWVGSSTSCSSFLPSLSLSLAPASPPVSLSIRWFLCLLGLPIPHLPHLSLSLSLSPLPSRPAPHAHTLSLDTQGGPGLAHSAPQGYRPSRPAQPASSPLSSHPLPLSHPHPQGMRRLESRLRPPRHRD